MIPFGRQIYEDWNEIQTDYPQFVQNIPCNVCKMAVISRISRPFCPSKYKMSVNHGIFPDISRCRPLMLRPRIVEGPMLHSLKY